MSSATSSAREPAATAVITIEEPLVIRARRETRKPETVATPTDLYVDGRSSARPRPSAPAVAPPVAGQTGVRTRPSIPDHELSKPLRRAMAVAAMRRGDYARAKELLNQNRFEDGLMAFAIMGAQAGAGLLMFLADAMPVTAAVVGVATSFESCEQADISAPLGAGAARTRLLGARLRLKGMIPDEVPDDLIEMLVLAEARAGARGGIGRVVMRDLADAPRLSNLYGEGRWVKMEHVYHLDDGRQINVHWFRNLDTEMDFEFKFKIRKRDGVHRLPSSGGE